MLKSAYKNVFLPLIKSHDNGSVFWPDFASSHYGKLTMEWYNKKKKKDVNIVPKTDNTHFFCLIPYIIFNRANLKVFIKTFYINNYL